MDYDYTKHPIKTFMDAAIPVCLNCDNQFLGNTTSSDEIDHFIYDLGLDMSMEAKIEKAKDCVLTSA